MPTIKFPKFGGGRTKAYKPYEDNLADWIESQKKVSDDILRLKKQWGEENREVCVVCGVGFFGSPFNTKVNKESMCEPCLAKLEDKKQEWAKKNWKKALIRKGSKKHCPKCGIHIKACKCKNRVAIRKLRK